QKFFDSANTIMHTPNPNTASNKFKPACLTGGRHAAQSITANDPAYVAAFSSPTSAGPLCRMSAANTGIIATAPPNSTANRSSAIDPTSTWLANTYFTPSTMLRNTGSRSATGGTGRLGINATHSQAAANRALMRL